MAKTITIQKGVHQGCIFPHCLFNSYAQYIIRNARVDESQAGIKIAWRNTNNLRYVNNTTRKWRWTKELLDEGGRGEWISWLKTQHSVKEDHGIWPYCFMANGQNVKTVSDFIFLDSKVTGDCVCNCEIKWCLLLGRMAMTNLDKILKSRDFTLLTMAKCPYSQSYGFSSSLVRIWELDHKED